MRFAAIAGVAAMLTAVATPVAASPRPIYVQTDPEPETPPSTTSAYEQAWLNYNAVIAGQLELSELGRAELHDLLVLDREIRAQQPDTRTPREKCIDAELARLEPEPTEFALRSIDLKCSQR